MKSKCIVLVFLALCSCVVLINANARNSRKKKGPTVRLRAPQRWIFKTQGKYSYIIHI